MHSLCIRCKSSQETGVFTTTRLKVNSVLDREPNNYSKFSSFPNLSNVAEIVQFFYVFVILISYLNEWKNKILPQQM